MIAIEFSQANEPLSNDEFFGDNFDAASGGLVSSDGGSDEILTTDESQDSENDSEQETSEEDEDQDFDFFDDFEDEDLYEVQDYLD